MEYSRVIAARIRELCYKRNISVNRLAEMSGRRQSTLSNIMHGESQNPRIKTLHKIALAFGMTLAELLDVADRDMYRHKRERREADGRPERLD